jgi:Xaa-Pro aminopeptidase
MRNPKSLFFDGNAEAVLIVGEVNKFYFTDFIGESSILLLLPDRAFFFTDGRYIEAAKELLEKNGENSVEKTLKDAQNNAENTTKNTEKTLKIDRKNAENVQKNDEKILKNDENIEKNAENASKNAEKTPKNDRKIGENTAENTEKNDENFPCEVVDITGRNPFGVVKDVLSDAKIGRLGFENLTVSYAEYLIFERLGVVLAPFSERINAMRRVKTGREIERIAKAAEITEKTLLKITEFLREGMTEREVADEIFGHMRRLGADGVSFEPIVAFDANTSRPHHVYGGAKLKNGSVVTVDLGAKYRGYCGDMTRSFAFGTRAKIPDDYKKIYAATLDAQRAALDFIAEKWGDTAAVKEKYGSEFEKYGGFKDGKNGFGIEKYNGISRSDTAVFGGKNSGISLNNAEYSPPWEGRRGGATDTAAFAEKNGGFENIGTDISENKKRRGVSAKDADTVARNVIEKHGYGRFFTHSLGHSVGLEIHEEPRLSQSSDAVLNLGDVFTVEPGIYLENRFGVRIEDMVLTTENGVRNFYTMGKELIYL